MFRLNLNDVRSSSTAASVAPTLEPSLPRSGFPIREGAFSFSRVLLRGTGGRVVGVGEWEECGGMEGAEIRKCGCVERWQE